MIKNLGMIAPISIALLVAAFAVACSAETTNDEDFHAKGAELLLPFKRDLKTALVSGLEEGAVSAIGVCKDEAPAIASKLSIDGVKVGRTSHRLRNPANQASDWVNTVLESYLEKNTKFEPVVTRLPDSRVGYAEAILVQPLCLTCHGNSLAPEVAARIHESYPADEATGFAVGELRGLYWVEFPQDVDSE
ncbi:MAG: Tll0287-like domain-containing protein [Woeseiaceae bacterium]